MTLIKRIKDWFWLVPWLLPFAAIGVYVMFDQHVQHRTKIADRLVDELCEKYGGITVYEQVEAPEHYFRRYLNGEHIPSTPFLSDAKEKDPFVYGDVREKILINGDPHRTGYPTVTVTDIPIIRKSDGMVLSKRTDVKRIGGDRFLSMWLGNQIYLFAPSNYKCKRPAGSGSDLAAMTYLNSPLFDPFRKPEQQPRITYELRKKAS